jgi:acyl-CoA synthetase (AMP-forming)/AMP-acid ligase II
MMAALRREKCSHTMLVPVMIHALLGVKATQGQKLEHLKSVMFGGALLNPAVLKTCIDGLGAKMVENAYGLTEGVVVTTGAQSTPMSMVKGDDVSIGWVIPGTALKACAPGEKLPVPRGTAGEFHWHSPNLEEGYIGKQSDDFYYDDQGRLWFITGDQGVIDPDGRIFIVGRYKDMIIRAGENISPAAIEFVLASSPKLATLQTQVVAAPDSIAGEVPVAIVQGTVDSGIVKDIQDAIISKMGIIYVPDEVLTLVLLRFFLPMLTV